MGLGYTWQNTIILVGSKNASTGALTPATLTASYAGNSRTISTGNMSKANFSISYTLGAAETSNNINVKIESSPDNINFYQIPNESVSGATSTLTQREFTFVGASAGSPYNFSLPIDIQDKYLKISFYESNITTNFGTVYAEVMLSGQE
jgi:hypothetical protein